LSFLSIEPTQLRKQASGDKIVQTRDGTRPGVTGTRKQSKVLRS